MASQIPAYLGALSLGTMDDISDISTASTDSTFEGVQHLPATPPSFIPYSFKVGLPSPLLLLLAILFIHFFISIPKDTEPRANKGVRQFISSRGNEYFCEIDEEYLTDRFNLTGLNTEVHYYQHALDLVNDVFDLDCDDEMRDAIEKSARHLYGLIHARYIVTTRGLAKMLDKYKRADFGKCPRVHCDSHPLLPMGLSDIPHQKPVKMYCAKCEDLYNPKATRHSTIDGAYFGSSFHNILFQVYPALVPEKSRARHVPRVFGFKVHVAAALARWQDGARVEQRRRLRDAGVEGAGYVEDEVEGDELADEGDGDEDGLLENHEDDEEGEGGGVPEGSGNGNDEGVMEEVRQ